MVYLQVEGIVNVLLYILGTPTTIQVKKYFIFLKFIKWAQFST